MSNQVETTTTKEVVKPVDTSIDIDEITIIIRLSAILAVGGVIASTLAFVFVPSVTLELMMALPVVGVALPWLVYIIYEAHRLSHKWASTSRRQRLIAVQERQALLELVGDVNKDGKLTNTDIAIQRQDENDIVEFVRQVWLLDKSHSRHTWNEQGVSFERWQWLIDKCVGAGLMTVRYDAAGRRHTDKMKITFQAAVVQLENAGILKLTSANEYLGRTNRTPHPEPVTTLDM